MRICAAVFTVLLAACGSGPANGGSSGSSGATSSGGSSGGGTGSAATSSNGGTTGTSTSGGGNKLNFTGSGTFTATGASATLDPVITLGGIGTGFQFQFNDVNQAGTGTFAFSTPTDIDFEDGQVTINLPSAPATGTYTQASSGVCTVAEITYSNMTSTDGDTFLAGNGSCPGGTASKGSWSLSFTSVTMTSIAGVYNAHGSLTMTLVDAMGNDGSVSVTF